MFSKRERLLICLIAISLLIELSLSQTKPKRRNRNRNRNRKQKEPEERLKCYSCYVDFSLKFNPKNLCYNPNLNQSLTDTLLLTQCSPFTKFCTVDITRVNKVLAIIDRRCGLPTCREICLQKGYGVERETCTYCCKGKLTEDDDEYDEYEAGNYTCPTVPHWNLPLYCLIMNLSWSYWISLFYQIFLPDNYSLTYLSIEKC